MSVAPSPTRVVPRRSGLGFTVSVSVAMLLGALAMGFVLLASDAPGAIVVGAVLAALPVGPVLGCFLWLDRYEPEPRTLLLLGLGWGAFVATSSALVLQLVGEFAFRAPQSFSGAVVAPVTEEAAKGLFILLLLFFRRNELDGVLDGIVYAGMVGVGFAFVENILYLSSAYVGEQGQLGGIGSAVGLFVVRGIFSPFAHPLFTTFTGIGVGLAVVSRRPAVRVLAPIGGYLLAVAAHATWNASAFMGGGRGFVLTYLFVMVPAFALLAGFAIWARRREARMLTDSLADCARRGFLDPAEVPWLVRLPARRAARRYARQAGGPDALGVMREYQQTAVELGFLHSRYLRGTAPRDATARGQAYVDQLIRLRPHLVWPRATGPSGAVGPAAGGLA
ncbi:protease PrsW [Nocardioides mangrovicus]|uniref:Protease PrsW n=1 Tax=Nocardioides mangrovicus TaxID=2478913 RepID=A0A3L8P3Y5_9ACTN|nr:PrsW family intramembrane metalloprotease [Nocardioides mangrovicus]RLV49752.1 protease PrsW [Nocardioides mangrovicus]